MIFIGFWCFVCVMVIRSRAIRARSRRLKTDFPSWVSKSSVPALVSFQGALHRRFPALSDSELFSLALLKWARRGHSDENPRRPEFPFFHPRFPATPTKRIVVPGLEHLVLLVKDESVNPTGTHKDRMAWEVLRPYERLLEERGRKSRNVELPAVSIISAGNAAIALGELFRKFGLPKPRVLVDSKLSESQVQRLRSHHLEVFEIDLSRRELSSDDILRLTKNPRGFDLTRGQFEAELSRNFFDWMTFEILNQNPNFVVVPYGSGNLFDNLYQHFFDQLQRKQPDPRLLTPQAVKPGLNLIGVTAPVGSLASMLSAPHLPESSKAEVFSQKTNVISQMVRAGVLGDKSQIAEVSDSWLVKASQIALQNRLRFEPSALAGLAWVLSHKKQIPSGARVLVVNTGRGWVE